MKLTKYLLPFFPDNEWLREHWWHRLVKSIAYIWLVIIILIGVGFIVNLYSNWVFDNTYNPDGSNWLYHPSDFTTLLPDFRDTLIIALIVGVLPINVIYRILLYIFTNNHWRQRKAKPDLNPQ